MGLEDFIAEWSANLGGAERANYGIFIERLCGVLNIPGPSPATGGVLGDYQIDAPVKGGSLNSPDGTGFIDCYKRGCFILEAKQSRTSTGQKKPPRAAQPSLALDLPEAPLPDAPPGGLDKLMKAALAQARNYAAHLPGDHPAPKFLIVCDVGRALELYYDYTGNGRGYDFFPDRQSYRIALDDLRRPEIRDRLRAVWLNPASIDPRAESADITRGVMRRLAELSRELDRRTDAGKGQAGATREANAHFIMRLIFCMFAEDVGLLPENSFAAFINDAIDDPDYFKTGLEDLWRAMDRAHGDRFALALKTRVRHFNGGLFRDHGAYPLSPEEIAIVAAAAKAKWSKVEPAIFGTLFEQALKEEERAELGAHYTPRPYVQRLIDEVFARELREEWQATETAILSLAAAGDHGAALNAARAFHARLGSLRILDPACGTANFLYVAMEQLLRLEGQVLETIAAIGPRDAPRIQPSQFIGLELNTRAAVIAELVLWIGWLRFRAGNDAAAIPDPVLASTAAINGGRPGGFDALLVADEPHDPDSRAALPPPWPEADYIVGNPPFIGGKDIRAELGDRYAETLWRSNPDVPPSADLVMHWWDRAARILRAPGTALKAFGFVTTNSITQEFSRRVIARHLTPPPCGAAAEAGAPANASSRGGWGGATRAEGAAGVGSSHAPQPAPPQGEVSAQPTEGASPSAPATEQPLSLAFAIPDHPWMKKPRAEPGARRRNKAGASKEKADVRIAMTVARAGLHEGRLCRVVSETALDTDAPQVELSEPAVGRINSDLRVGTDVGETVPLRANAGLCSRGVQLMGQGFSITAEQAHQLGLGRRPGLEARIRPYRNGKDIVQASRGRFVIDFHGRSVEDVRAFPEVYAHLRNTVWQAREAQVAKSPTADAKAYLEKWWLFGKTRGELRAALAGLPRYIATVETAKHRIFQFLSGDILPDNKIIVIASDSAFHLGVLLSRPHQEWTFFRCGLRGIAKFEQGHVYVKTTCFDPFPFPNATPAQRAAIAAKAEAIEAQRARAMAEARDGTVHNAPAPNLTLTELYNVVRDGEAAIASLRDRNRPFFANRARPLVAAHALILRDLHAELDSLVAAAYGWDARLSPDALIARLVALNAERAAEEAAGTIRHLRPEYQVARAASPGAAAGQMGDAAGANEPA